MEDYKVRFINEFNELVEKQRKLKSMLERYHDGTLDFTPTCPITLLEEQNRVMEQYILILEERAVIEGISTLKSPTSPTMLAK